MALFLAKNIIHVAVLIAHHVAGISNGNGTNFDLTPRSRIYVPVEEKREIELACVYGNDDEMTHIGSLVSLTMPNEVTTVSVTPSAEVSVKSNDAALDRIIAQYGPELSPGETTELVLGNDDVAMKLKQLDLRMNVIPSEKLLMSAPIAVVVLAYLTLLANGDNFKLAEELPNKQPRQFRDAYLADAVTTLHMHASNAFQTANAKMQTIKLSMENVPAAIKEIREAIEHKEPALFKPALEKILERLQEIAKRCSTAARETSEVFKKTQNMMLELKQVVVATRSVAKVDRDEVEKELKIYQMQHQGTQALLDKMNHELEYLSKLADEQKKNYDDAIANVPTGWTAVFQDVARTYDFSAAFQAVTTVFAARFGGMGMGAMSMGAMSMAGPMSMFGSGGSYGGASDYGNGGSYGGKRAAFASDAALLNTDLFKSNVMVLPRVCQAYQDVTRKAFEKLRSTNRTARDYEDFCTTHDIAARHLHATFKKGARDSMDYNRIHKSFKKSLAATNHCIAETSSARKRNANNDYRPDSAYDDIQSTSDEFAEDEYKEELKQPSLSSGRGGMQTTVGQHETNRGNERWIVAKQKEVLDATRQSQNIHRDHVYEMMKVLNDETASITNLTLVATDLKQVEAAASRAIRGLGTLAMHWAKLVAFFDSFAQLIDREFLDGVTKYDDSVQKLINHENPDATEKLKFINAQRNTINQEGQKLEVIAMVCMHLAGDFAYISSKHITKQLNEIGMIQSINPKNEPSRAKADLQKFAANAHDAMEDIKKMMEKNQKQMQLELDEATKKIEEIQKKAGQPSEDDKKRMEAAQKQIAAEHKTVGKRAMYNGHGHRT